MKCNNCGSVLSCTCERLVAADGTSCCKTCIGSYNALNPKNNKQTQRPKSASNTTPSNVSVIYRGPGVQH